MKAAIYASFAAAVLLFISGGLGILFGQPWLFPSLGPSALLHAYFPENRTGRFYNTAVGQGIGVAAGYLAVALVGAASSPAVISTELLTWPRVWATIIAVFLTAFFQIAVKAYHPPAAATALLISLGAFQWGKREIEILAIGILVIATAGVVVRAGARRIGVPTRQH